MLKTCLYFLMLLTTAIRFADVIYLLSRESTNLPMVIYILTSALILYGVVLVVKRFIGSVRIRQLMVFFIFHAVIFAFNITYVAVSVPLSIDMFEMAAVGTFLDILIDICAVYFCLKQRRKRLVTVGNIQ